MTSRGICGAFFLGTSLFLRIDCLRVPLSSIRFSWVLLYSSGLIVYVYRSLPYVFLGYFFIPQDWLFTCAALFHTFFLGTSLFLRIDCLRVPLSSIRFSWVLLYSSGLIVYVCRSLPYVFLGYFFIPQDWLFTCAALFHTYWDWVSMLMLMLLELIIYFVFVFRMLLPFYFIFSYT